MGLQKDSDSVPTIHAALNRGINWIDTAALYGLGTFLSTWLPTLCKTATYGPRSSRNVNASGTVTEKSVRRRGQYVPGIRVPCVCPLGLSPALAHDARPLAKGDELVRGNLFVLFVQAIRPVDVEVDRTDSP